MGLYDYLTVLRSRWRVLAATVLVVVGAVGALTAFATPQYTSRATVYFGTPFSSQANARLSDSLLYAQTIVRSYAEAATRPIVLQPVISQLGLPDSVDELADRIEAQSPLGTVIIEVRATDPSARRSAEIANAVARELSTVSGQLAPATRSDSPIVVSTITEALVPRFPSSPHKALNLAVALAWALMAGVLLCVWLDGIDPRVRSRRDVARVTAAPLIGYLPRQASRAGAGGINAVGTARAQHDAAGRAQWGRLRTNFSSLREGYGLHSILFVAAAAEEPPLQVIDHLSVSTLQTGLRVLVIDADLRSEHAAEDVWPRGLTTVLAGECSLDEAVVDRPYLPSILPAGPSLADPSAVVSSSSLTDVLRACVQRFDLVLIRSAPLEASTEGFVLAQHVDAVFLVGDDTAMRRGLLRRALSSLDRAGGRVRGVVLCA